MPRPPQQLQPGDYRPAPFSRSAHRRPWLSLRCPWFYISRPPRAIEPADGLVRPLVGCRVHADAGKAESAPARPRPARRPRRAPKKRRLPLASDSQDKSRVPVLDFFVLSYFRVFVIDPEELPWAMNSSRFPRLDAYRETNCGGMRSNRSQKHESTKTRQWPRWRRSLVRGGFLSSSIETARGRLRGTRHLCCLARLPRLVELGKIPRPW